MKNNYRKLYLKITEILQKTKLKNYNFNMIKAISKC